MKHLSVRPWLYWVLCLSLPGLAACIVFFALYAQGWGDQASTAASVDAAMGLGALMVGAVLTYPAGCVGTLAALLLMFGADLLTPTEATAVGVLLSTAAGHWQWYVLLPHRFRATAQPRAVAKSSQDPPAL